MPLVLPPRRIHSHYLDPVEAIWLATAARLGVRVERSATVYAATDGRGTLTLGSDETLDPDDCVGQLIFHELCHWITNGLETLHIPDWGFALDSDFDWREHSCLRLQAALTRPHGLSRVLAPTSDFRAYYDALGEDPLAPLEGWPEEEKVVALAKEAFNRAKELPWSEPFAQALAATAALQHVVAPFVDHLPPSPVGLRSIWRDESSG